MTVSGYYGRVQPLLGPDSLVHVFQKYRNANAYLEPIEHGRPSEFLRQQATIELIKHFGMDGVGPMMADVAFVQPCAATPLMRPRVPSWVPVVALPRSWPLQSPVHFQSMYSREPESIALNEPRARLAPDVLMTLQWAGDLGSPTAGEGLFYEAGDEPMWLREKPGTPIGDPDKLFRTSDEFMNAAAKYSTVITTNVEFAIVALLLRRTVVLLEKGMNQSIYETWLRGISECHWEGMPF